MKKLPLFLISYFIYFSLYSQPDSQVLLFDKISNLDYNSSEPDSIKLKSFYLLDQSQTWLGFAFSECSLITIR